MVTDMNIFSVSYEIQLSDQAQLTEPSLASLNFKHKRWNTKDFSFQVLSSFENRSMVTRQQYPRCCRAATCFKKAFFQHEPKTKLFCYILNSACFTEHYNVFSLLFFNSGSLRMSVVHCLGKTQIIFLTFSSFILWLFNENMCIKMHIID